MLSALSCDAMVCLPSAAANAATSKPHASEAVPSVAEVSRFRKRPLHSSRKPTLPD
jgi:hypothetical protein